MKILINARRMFIFTRVIEIGLSDLHLMKGDYFKRNV